MRWILVLLSLAACVMPWRYALAQEVSGQAVIDALTARTPGTTLNRLRARPDAFVEEAAGLILGYGGPDGLSAQDIETAIAAERARLRAREMRRLLEADLNDDLAVTRAEMAVILRAASATMRGRLLVWHRAADRDGDGTASWQELRQFAALRANVGLNDQTAASMRAMMTFDLDGDGRVALDEVLDAVSMLGAPA
ncbi:EF-hand domain-containing protein [uncultured Tateyamaria sp.]|uniref:EF-hand domain-containing protein n=1 Tax=uncultured Tateyamaria sp. TaxID=455651 RepID=UPI00262A0842|nr:EF-hand domain-containing protein [uncultured Tateyamaria sp.]